MLKKCTALWREARFQVKMYKAHPFSEHFWKLRCRKSARRCGAKHISKSKCTKHTILGALLEVEMSKKCTPLWREDARSTFWSQNVQSTPILRTLLEVEMSKKCTPLWREARFQVKMLKTPHARTTFEGSDVVFFGRRKGFCTLPKVSKTWRFVAFPKSMAGMGHLKRIWKDAFRVAGAVQEMCSSEMLGGQGADFLRRGALWSIRSSGLLRWFCAAGAALHMTWPHFCGRRSTVNRWKGKIAKCIGTRPSALHSTFHVWRKSRRIASFLLLSLSTSKIEEVSQNCFVFKLADRQIDNYNYHYTTVTTTNANIPRYIALRQLDYSALIALHYIAVRYTTLHYINYTAATTTATTTTTTTATTTSTTTTATTTTTTTTTTATTNYTTATTPLRYTTTPLRYTTTTTTTALHHATSSSCGEVTTATIATTPRNTTPTTFRSIRSAIRVSQQPTSPIGFLFLKLPPPPCAVLLI